MINWLMRFSVLFYRLTLISFFIFLSKFLKALVCLHSRGLKVSDVIQGVLRFYKAIMEGGKETAGKYLSLLSFLCQMRRPSIKK